MSSNKVVNINMNSSYSVFSKLIKFFNTDVNIIT